MTQTSSGYINVGDGELYYEVASEGAPLVLSHAGFVDSRMWDDQWSDFAQHQRVIRFDMRGFGKSALGVTPIERRRDLDRLLQQLGVPRTALLGCSLWRRKSCPSASPSAPPRIARTGRIGHPG